MGDRRGRRRGRGGRKKRVAENGKANLSVSPGGDVHASPTRSLATGSRQNTTSFRSFLRRPSPSSEVFSDGINRSLSDLSAGAARFISGMRSDGFEGGATTANEGVLVNNTGFLTSGLSSSIKQSRFPSDACSGRPVAPASTQCLDGESYSLCSMRPNTSERKPLSVSAHAYARQMLDTDFCVI